MPYLAPTGTDLGCWGTPQHWVAGDDDDASTRVGEAGGPHTHADLDVAEIDVSFTGIDGIGYEGVGFAERFGGYELVEAEVTSVGGALPVNPSGGPKAKGHPPGATGVAQCVELFAQLRGEAVNQVDGARVALAPDISGPTAVSAVTILEGPANGAG
jgi:acetyl-CoA C-acetyltransferase